MGVSPAHSQRARSHNSQLQLIPWLVEHQRSMGLVKAVRQRHRRNAARSVDIWTSALTGHQWQDAHPTRLNNLFLGSPLVPFYRESFFTT
ncbi:hypothetical protein [Calothrix sp. FACHB-168]|uniref:hypothetical protein n=1 Tax=Calothrix sp. FACHB-168 TaxID=2692780 RepID=UPI00168941E9|nr:hypothetical protein [Calothrix sp. FACHB-168]MBD2203712.1 hypothetical protein [Calothrix sp. FACHB-168]